MSCQIQRILGFVLAGIGITAITGLFTCLYADVMNNNYFKGFCATLISYILVVLIIGFIDLVINLLDCNF